MIGAGKGPRNRLKGDSIKAFDKCPLWDNLKKDIKKTLKKDKVKKWNIIGIILIIKQGRAEVKRSVTGRINSLIELRVQILHWA